MEDLSECEYSLQGYGHSFIPLEKRGGVEDFGSRDIGGMGVGLDKRIQGELKEKEIIQGGGLRF